MRPVAIASRSCAKDGIEEIGIAVVVSSGKADGSAEPSYNKIGASEPDY
jgi:hypothetical protein